ncbi:MAG: hypothetical protein CENE_01097 [Candidatus Celerinatantimonas neptuna]|nr:MAG: hypothetical protein CENE_01097 [Candidatus Celerinatantimonas neptuna]
MINYIDVFVIIVNDVIKVTVQACYLTQYYMARRGERRIYLAIFFTKELMLVPCVRYIFRTQHSKLPNEPEPSDLTKVVRTIEAKDIYALSNGLALSRWDK